MQRKIDQERRNTEGEVDSLAKLEIQREIDRERRNAQSEEDRLVRLGTQGK